MLYAVRQGAPVAWQKWQILGRSTLWHVRYGWFRKSGAGSCWWACLLEVCFGFWCRKCLLSKLHKCCKHCSSCTNEAGLKFHHVPSIPNTAEPCQTLQGTVAVFSALPCFQVLLVHAHSNGCDIGDMRQTLQSISESLKVHVRLTRFDQGASCLFPSTSGLYAQVPDTLLSPIRVLTSTPSLLLLVFGLNSPDFPVTGGEGVVGEARAGPEPFGRRAGVALGGLEP